MANEVSRAHKKLEAGKEEVSTKGTMVMISNSYFTYDCLGNGEEGVQSPPSKEEEAFQRKVKEMSGHMFTVMWHVTELDIVSTITEVCFKVIIRISSD